MKLILLGCGYLGYNLSNEFTKDGFEVSCVGIQSPYSALMYQRFTNVDVFDPKQLATIDFQDAVVIDTISTVDNHQKSDDEETLLLGLEETYRTLLDYLYKAGAKKIIFVSSGAVYGNTEKPVDEDAEVHPINLYTRSKVRLEKIVEESPLDYLILRVASPYGGFRMTNKRQGVIPILLEKALDGEVFEMLKDESTVRDYFYITDFAKAVELLLENEVTNEIINVGSGKGYSLKSIIEVVKRTTGESVKIKKVKPNVPIVDGIVLDVSKLVRRTGFECEIGITSGVYKELNRILVSRGK